MTDNKRPSRPPPSAPPQSLPPTDDERFMDVALVHAKGGQPSPNPHVGAVVVKDGQVVGAGFHERAGAEHAEVAAIRAAGDNAKGATLYVTLEPCNHHGRTPPCTDAILAAKIARVVIGCLDPNPHVEGGGAEALRAANVEVVVGVREAQAQKTIAPWAKFVTVGLPYVSLKLALSLDGRIATRSGASRWVTGPDARAKVHLLRSRSDGCAVGIGTALADDPRLTVRDVAGASPVRIIFDTNLRLPTNSRLAQTAKDIPTWLICGLDASPATEVELAAMGVECMRVPLASEGRVEVAAALRLLASRGIVSLMVEGGAELAGSLLASRFADELHVFLAPILLGPRGRPGAVDWAGPDTPQQAPRIASPSWELVGEDAYVHGQIAYPT
jgi:diaminohydroxyphosphoribosylaminopyrimidine deaminase/5-amino-6-(5-phosphoribosylamino)uracil reductase